MTDKTTLQKIGGLKRTLIIIIEVYTAFRKFPYQQEYRRHLTIVNAFANFIQPTSSIADALIVAKVAGKKHIETGAQVNTITKEIFNEIMANGQESTNNESLRLSSQNKPIESICF